MIKIEMRSMQSKNSPWKDTTLENMFEVLKITRDILRQGMSKHSLVDLNDYSEDRALWNIKAGRIISTPMLDFRLAEGTTCPKCGSKFVDVCGALSRRDNKTKICSNCGVLEAMEDIANMKK